MSKKIDFLLGMLFAVATIVFIVIFLTNDIFFNWAFARHHNILSWYIRPLFIIPMVIFAFKKSLLVYTLQYLLYLQVCSGFPFQLQIVLKF